MTVIYKLLYVAAMGELINPGDAWEQNFIKQMQRLRDAHGMTQTDLARAAKAHGLKFHQQTIQRIEAGERPVRLGEAHIIAGIFGVNLDVMTSTEPSSKELRLAATRMRRESSALLESLGGQFNEWLESVRYFEKVLNDRIAENPDAPDDAALWGLRWADLVIEPFSQFVFPLSWLSKLDDPKSSDLLNLSNELKEVLDRMKALEQRYGDQLNRIPPWRSFSELDSRFPGDRSGNVQSSPVRGLDFGGQRFNYGPSAPKGESDGGES